MGASSRRAPGSFWGPRPPCGRPGHCADVSLCGVLCTAELSDFCRKGLWAGLLEPYFAVLSAYSRCCAERCPGPAARPPAACHSLRPRECPGYGFMPPRPSVL